VCVLLLDWTQTDTEFVPEMGCVSTWASDPVPGRVYVSVFRVQNETMLGSLLAEELSGHLYYH